MKSKANRLIDAAKLLSASLEHLDFRSPVTHVYNPLSYAWKSHEVYLRRYGDNRKRVVFLGMNPGPFGMAQTGVPFGEVAAVRNWLHIEGPTAKPPHEHPKRPVLGFACPRSEVSGRRLWGLFAARFGTAEKFFAEHFVVNYCPLAFFEISGRNRTPDKLPTAELASVVRACDAHLQRIMEILKPEFLIGVGRFAEARAKMVCLDRPMRIGTILHPSPASPAANRDWEGKATAQLKAFGIWR